MGHLVLLRHGESQWNLENRFTGWVDVPLSPRGMQEAKNAGEKLRPYRFDRAFTSVLQRANETLRLALEVIGQTEIPTERDKALNERMYGELQGLNKAETAKKFGYSNGTSTSAASPTVVKGSFSTSTAVAVNGTPKVGIWC